MNGARVVTHGSKLLGLAIIGIGSVVDGFGRPDPDMAIYSCQTMTILSLALRSFKHVTSSGCDQPSSVWGDMAAIHLKVLFLATVRQP